MSGPIAQQTSGTSTVQRGGGGSSGSSLADVLDLILEKGLVIDIFARVSLVGIEILTVDVRIVVASVDTYLRFAEACNRLDIAHDGTSKGLPQMIDDMTESGARSKTKGALEGAGEKLKDAFGKSDEEEEKEPARSRRSSRKKEDDE
jgi:hypothetical protein